MWKIKLLMILGLVSGGWGTIKLYSSIIPSKKPYSIGVCIKENHQTDPEALLKVNLSREGLRFILYGIIANFIAVLFQ